MELFAKTNEELFLKKIGRKLVDTAMFGPQEILEDEKEQEFYLNLKRSEISIPILEGYGEKAEEKAFSDDTQLGCDYRKARFAEEAVRAFSLIRKIAEREEDRNLVSKVNTKIISIGDKANKFRPEYALEGVRYGIDFAAVPDANIDGNDNLIWSSPEEFYFETELIEYNKEGQITIYPNEVLDFKPVYTIAPYTVGDYTITTEVI